MQSEGPDIFDVFEALANYVIAADEVFDCELEAGTSIVMRNALFIGAAS